MLPRILILSCVTLSIALKIVENAPTATICKQRLIKADKCLRRVLYIGDPDINYIQTKKALQKYCKEARRNVRCIERYKKCLKLFPLQIFSIMVSNAKTIIKERCGTRGGRKEFLNIAQCMRKPEVFEANKCIDIGIKQIDYVATNATELNIFPGTCCMMQDLKRCFRVTMDRLCIGYIKDGDQVAPYAMKIVQTLTSDVVDIACGTFTEEKACRAKIPKLFGQMRALGDHITVQETSFMIPLLKVVKRLGFE